MTEYCLPRPKGRRMRKGSAQQQMASNSLPSLPSTQYQHHTEAAGQMTQGQTNAHVVQQVTKVNEIERSTENTKQEKLSWVVILLLVGLIVFNVILYVKLWRLDEHQETSETDFMGHRLEFLR